MNDGSSSSFSHQIPPFLLLNFHLQRSGRTMNGASVSRTDLVEGDSSDSDTSSEGIPEYYEPISSLDNAEEEDGDSNAPHCNGYHHHHHHHHHVIEPHSRSLGPSNGHLDYGAAAMEENGVRLLNIGQDQERESEEDEEEEEEERTGAELDSAMRRALEADESRRNAPLPEENAVRVMEAMRGITFSGVPPDWATDVSEDSWADQLRRLRQSPHSAAS